MATEVTEATVVTEATGATEATVATEVESDTVAMAAMAADTTADNVFRNRLRGKKLLKHIVL